MGGGVGLLNSEPAEMSPATTDSCTCRSGRFCTGPRGGHYCKTDAGTKSYLRQ
jgi:hypothetical protein